MHNTSMHNLADVVCPELMNPDNGQVNLLGMDFGSVASYSCDSGYNLIGSVIRMCTFEGTWSGEDPICQGR